MNTEKIKSHNTKTILKAPLQKDIKIKNNTKKNISQNTQEYKRTLKNIQIISVSKMRQPIKNRPKQDGFTNTKLHKVQNLIKLETSNKPPIQAVI